MTSTRTSPVRRLAAALLTTVLLATGCGLNNGGSVPLPVSPGPAGTVPELEGVRITVTDAAETDRLLAALGM